MKKIISLLLCTALLFTFASCTPTAISKNAVNLMQDRQVKDIAMVTDPVDDAKIADFAVRLFSQSFEGEENTLMSPVSVLYALAMTVNGADGETFEQVQSVLGVPVGDLNNYLKYYKDKLSSTEKCKLAIANSIWLKDKGLEVEENFLDTNAYYYGADVYKAPFDKTTINDINAWVNQNTDGMIKKLADELPPEAVMCLLNAVMFDAEWSNIYKETQIRDTKFTKLDGSQTTVEMMYGSEYKYLEDEFAQGFVKSYAGGKYGFAALLPNEGVSIKEYVDSLTGEHLNSMLKNPQKTEVRTGIPKFKTDNTFELKDILAEMGMTDAFTNAADFSRTGTYNGEDLYITSVIHKTTIEVDARGTKAGAITAVIDAPTSAAPPEKEPPKVILDRPFIYMIVDLETGTPIFMGALTNPS